MPPLFEDLLDQNMGKLGGDNSDFHNLEDTRSLGHKVEPKLNKKIGYRQA